MGSDTGASSRWWRFRSALLSSASAVVLVSAVLVTTAITRESPAAADQVTSLQVQAKQIAETLIREELQVGAYQQQYSVVSVQVQKDAAVIAQTQQQLAADQHRIDVDGAKVRTQAVIDYMNAGTDSTGTAAIMLSSGGNSAIAQHEYQGIATGNITTDIANLHASKLVLQQHETSLQIQESQDQAAQARQAGDLREATTTQSQLSAEQAQVTGQLAQAVAAQQAAADAAAQAAVKAAQQQAAANAAAHKAPVTNVASSPSTGGVAGTASVAAAPARPAPTPTATFSGGSDPALNPFLQCVVQAESSGNYEAVSPNGVYMGAFQFDQSTWNGAAGAAGRPDLIGVRPNNASKADQDTLAVTLYTLDGRSPWLGDRCAS